MGEKRIRRVNIIPPLPLTPSGEVRKRRVAAYARVSTSSEEQGNSLVAQRDYYEKLILGKAEWELVEIYYDEGISGLSHHNRDGFNRMISDAIEGKIDLILTKSISRFARNTVDTLKNIRLLKEHGVEVFFEKENIHTLDSNGELLITLMSSLAQEESRSISENITWGFRKKFADGKYSMPYKNFLGYAKGTEGTPVVVEEEAVIVRLIYMLYLQGSSIFKIAAYLDATGVPSPMGKTWDVTVIGNMLRNEKYKGDARLQKSITVDYLTGKRKPNEGEAPMYYLTDSHPAVVSREAWDLVQEELARRGNSENKFSCTDTLASKIICEDCGGFYGIKSIRRDGKLYGMFWRCNHFYVNECKSPCFLEETIADYCRLVIGDLFTYYHDVIDFCASLLQAQNFSNPALVETENIREWFVNQLDCIILDDDILRTIIYGIYPNGCKNIKFMMYDGMEITYRADKRGKKMHATTRDLIENRSKHIPTPPYIEKKPFALEKVKQPKVLTEAEEENIVLLRLQGSSYANIAAVMEKPVTLIKECCFKHEVDGYKPPARPKILTNDRWSKVYVLRTAGYSVNQIHRITGINEDTIKSRCIRFGLLGDYTKTPSTRYCTYCGKRLEHIPGKKKKEFCSDDCRNDWWALQRRAKKIEEEFLSSKEENE